MTKAPEGVPVQLLELSRLKPRKDRHSHPGDTGRYGAGVLRLLRRPRPRTHGGRMPSLRPRKRRAQMPDRFPKHSRLGRPLPGRY